jgi:hypothetical protein
MLLFQKIVKNNTEVNLALDKDIYMKALRIAERLNFYNIKTNLVDTRGAEDVGDMSKEFFLKKLEDSKEYSYNMLIKSKIRML